jgi:hypothetical protein
MRFHGPLKPETGNTQKHFSSEKLQYLPSFPNLIYPFMQLFNEIPIYEFITVAQETEPYDGFQFIKTDAPTIEKVQKYCRQYAKGKTRLLGKEIFSFDAEPQAKYWDYGAKSPSEKVHFCVISSDTILAATSLAYFKPNSSFSKMIPTKLGPAKTITLFNENNSSTSNYFQAERIFGTKDLFFQKEVPQRIEAIQFFKSDDLMQKPFKVIIMTHKDSEKDAKLLFKQFTDLSDDKKSLKRLEACKYELTIDSDQEFFYVCLLCLMACGNPDSAERTFEK